MTTYYLNGNPIQEGSDVVIDGFTYPYSWLEGTSLSVRSSLNIEKVGDINYDPKYYWSKGNPKLLEDREEVDSDGNPLYVKVSGIIEGYPGMVDSDKRLVNFGLKTICSQEIKATTQQLLLSTDTYILRNAVEQVDIPENVSSYRAAVIQESTRLQNLIPTVTSVEELIEVMSSVNWPSNNK